MRSSNTNGITVTYSYDVLNRLSTVIDNRLATGANTTTSVYSPTSALKSVTLPNTAQTTYGYDPLDRLTSLTARTGATTLANITYTLWPEGNRKHATEQFGAGTRQVDYSYDTASRLLTETVTLGTPSGVIGYTYDPVGNRLSRTSTVVGITATSATYDTNDQLVGTTYDSNGNTTLASGVTYGYDFLNRLTSATGLTLKYDGDGNRVQETVGSAITNYLVDDNNPTGYPQVVEELVGGVVQRRYRGFLLNPSKR